MVADARVRDFETRFDALDDGMPVQEAIRKLGTPTKTRKGAEMSAACTDKGSEMELVYSFSMRVVPLGTQANTVQQFSLCVDRTLRVTGKRKGLVTY